MVRGTPGVADPSLYSAQFQDWLGPFGSYGEPVAAYGVAGDNSGVLTPGPGGIYGA